MIHIFVRAAQSSLGIWLARVEHSDALVALLYVPREPGSQRDRIEKIKIQLLRVGQINLGT